MLRALALLFVCSTFISCSTETAPSEPASPRVTPKPDVPAPTAEPQPKSSQRPATPVLEKKDDPERPRMMAACGSCHALPNPTEFTDRTWAQAIPYMYRIHAEFFSEQKALPPIEEVQAYYRRNSAKRVSSPTLYPPSKDLSFAWSHQELTGGPSMVVDLKGDTGVDVLTGRVFELSGPNTPLTVTTTGRHPVRALKADLDRDGTQEWVVAELGAFVAKDTHLGGVTIVQGDHRVSVLSSVGRVADVAAGDLNGDGRPDLVVAEFGWQKTGGLHVLLQKKKPLTFHKRTLSADAGVVGLDLADMNGDGKLDIVTAVSQHHERIDLWTSDGEGFNQTTIFRATTPLWGALGLLLKDLDGDGRTDVVHWNGDTLDAPKLARFQGVHWLRNLPDRFVPQQLAELPGVHDVSVADFDRDGALDLVAVANLPPRIDETLWSSEQTPQGSVALESVLLVKQSTPGRFVTRSLLRNQPCFSSVTTTDWDQDGDMDLVLGSFGIGWALMGHHGDGGRTAIDGASCRSGGLFWLKNTQERATKPTQGQFTLAEEIQGLQTIIGNDPKDSRNRVNLGNALMRVGRFGEAESALRAAIKIDPNEKAAYINLALALGSRGRPKEAEAVCRELIKRAPQFGDGYSQLAAVLSRLGRTNEALDASRRAVMLDPNRVDYRLNLGVGLAQSGDLDGAEAEFRGVLKIKPGHPTAVRHLERVRRSKTRRGVPDPP